MVKENYGNIWSNFILRKLFNRKWQSNVNGNLGVHKTTYQHLVASVHHANSAILTFTLTKIKESIYRL